jgi:hypothetical protein
MLVVSAAALLGCASRTPRDAVRITGVESEVSGCERLGDIEVTKPGNVSLMPSGGTGEDAPHGAELPLNLDSQTADSLRYWAVQKGGDTVLVTSVKANAVRGIACRCAPS